MRRFIWILIVLLAAVVLGLMIAQTPGAVMLQVKNQTIAAPLWLATLGIVVLCVLFYVLVRIVRLIYLVPVGWRQAYLRSKFKKRQTVLKQGLSAYLIGDFKAAKGHFKTLASHRYLAPETHYMAASSALKEGDFDQAADFLSKATKLNIKDKLTRHLLEIDLAISKEYYADARSQILELKKQHPTSVPLLKRLLSVEMARKNYMGAIEVLPKLNKHLCKTDYEQTAVKAYCGAMLAAKSFDQLRQVYTAIAKPFALNAKVLSAYASACHHFGQDQVALKLIAPRLQKDDSDTLFLAYANLKHPDASCLSFAEKIFEANVPSADNLLAMAKLYQSQGVLSKARQYAQRSIKIAPSHEAAAILG